VANYFDRRDLAFEEPEDRILWKHLERFGDADIAGIVAPRALVIDRGGPDVLGEYQRARAYFEQANAAAAIRFSGERDQQNGPPRRPSNYLTRSCIPTSNGHFRSSDARRSAAFLRIANAQFSQWQARYRNLAMEAYAEREKLWRPDTSSAGNYRSWIKPFYAILLDTVGHYPAPSTLSRRGA